MGNLKRFYTIQDLPLATASNAGVIKPGNCLSVTSDGTLNVNVPQVFNDVISGYLQSNSFYKDAEKTIVIPGEQGKLYVNKPDDTLYLFNTAQAKFKGIGGNFVLFTGQGLQGEGTGLQPLSINPHDLIFDEQNSGFSIGMNNTDMNGDCKISFHGNNIDLIGHGTGAGFAIDGSEEHKLSFSQNEVAFSFKCNMPQEDEDWTYSNSFILRNDGDILINNRGLNQPNGLVQLDQYGKLQAYMQNLSQYQGNYWLNDNTVNGENISIKAVHDNINRSKVIIDNIVSEDNIVTVDLTEKQKQVLSHCSGFTVQFTIFGKSEDIKSLPNPFSLFAVGPFAEHYGMYGDNGTFMFHKDDDEIRDFKIETNAGSADGLRKIFEDDEEKTITITANNQQIIMYLNDVQEPLYKGQAVDFYNDVNLEWVQYNPHHVKDIKIWNRVLTEEEILSTLESTSTSAEESGKTLLELTTKQGNEGTKATITLNSFDIFSTNANNSNLLFSVTPNDIIYNGNSANRAGGLVTLGEDMEIQENSQSYTISKGNYKDCTSVAINPQKFQIKQNNLQRDATSTLKFYDYLNIHLEQQRDFESIRTSDYHFGGENFNLDNTFIVNKNQDYQSKNSVFNTGDTTFNTGDTNFNTGNVTFNTSDFVIVNLAEGGPTSEYEKTKFDFCDTINLSSKNTVRWDIPDYYDEDVDLAELQISNSQVNINLTHIDVIGEQGDQSPVYHYGKYEFKYDGLYFNGNAPNTAGGLVKLDSNSKIPKEHISIIASDVNALPNTTKYGKTIDLSLSNSDYVMSLKLKDQDGNVLSSNSIDLPLESMVVNGRYNSNSKSVVLTLKNGNEVSFSVADLVNGLQHTLTAGNGISIDENDEISNTGRLKFQREVQWQQEQEGEPITHIEILSNSLTFNNSDNGLQISIDWWGVADFSGDNTLNKSNYTLGKDFNVGANGISLSANSDMTLSADGDMTLSANFGISLSANGISLSADGDMTLSANGISLSADGIKYNGHSLNTAGGLVVLDSNSRLPSSVIAPFAQPIVKILSNYKDSNSKVIINDMTPGLIFAVINNENKHVYPDIEYVNGCAVLTASGVSDVKWVIYKMSNLIHNG